MPPSRKWLLALALPLLVVGCQSTPLPGPRLVWEAPKNETPERQYHLLNRLTWGANPSTSKEIASLGFDRYLEQQLRPLPKPVLPPELQRQVDAMTINRPLDQLIFDLEKQRRAVDAIKEDDQKKLAQQAYQQELTRLEREAATRSILRSLYSPNQLQEQMTWFWFNHFSVFRYKSNIRAMLGDYEENAIRPHALGRFRSLLGAVSHHPAMLRYLDNEQNGVNRINENYARELMELHTLGATGGYSQNDVQQLARILTGVGVNLTGELPKMNPKFAASHVRRGVFEFHPGRHDFGDKVLLGRTIRGRGLGEFEEALDMLARHPSTARFVSRKLAVFFVADEPPQRLVDAMAQTFLASDGDIAATLRTLFRSPDFSTSLGRKFKDPVHYVFSAVRLAYDDRPILNAQPIMNWLQRMGQPLYGRETPDGYPLTQSAWASPGQMTTRFEIARAIGSGSAGLFRIDGPQPVDRAAFPQISNALYYQAVEKTLSPTTLKALGEARSPQEWNTYLLSSPEFMNR